MGKLNNEILNSNNANNVNNNSNEQNNYSLINI